MARSKVHWNLSIVDFFVKAKSSTIEGLSTHDRVFFSENPIGQALIVNCECGYPLLVGPLLRESSLPW